jgi:DNA-binding MarR family transcriptional regulator
LKFEPYLEEKMPVKSSAQDVAVEAELAELIRSIRPVIAALKHAGPAPAIFEEAFARGALGPRHAPVLMMLAHEGQLSVSEVAQRLGLSLSTTSLLVGELDRAGLIVRVEDERDRRRTLVQLAEGYREAAEEWLQERMTPLRNTLARLSPEARAGFLEGWRILREETLRSLGGAPECAA